MRNFHDYLTSKSNLIEWPWSKSAAPAAHSFADNPEVQQNPKLLKLYGQLKAKFPGFADQFFQKALSHGPQAAEYHLQKMLTQPGYQIPKADDKFIDSEHDRFYGDLRTYKPGVGGMFAKALN